MEDTIVRGPFISATEVAKQLNISTMTVYRLATKKLITHCHFGDRVMFKQEWIDDFVARSTTR